MASIGSVSVSVVPSAEGFTDKLRAQLLPEADVLGDEIGKHLSEHINEQIKDVRLRVAVDNAAADAALEKTKLKADELPNDKKIDVSVNNSGGVMGWLTSLIAGAVAIAPAFAVAGVGVAAFTALAVPSISKVTTFEKDLQTGSAKTTQAWAALNSQQKTMAVGLHSLGTEFSSLQKAAAPSILNVFNAALSETSRFLPNLVPMAKSASVALTGLISQLGNALNDSQAQQFFAFVDKNIGPDIQQIGATVVSLLHLFFNLVEGMQPVSLALLHIVSGLADFLAELTKVAPWLTDIIVLSIALYKPLSALAALNLFEGISSTAAAAAAGVKLFMEATEGATIAERAMLAAELAVDAVSPWVWAGLAVAGFAALLLITRQNSDATQTWVSNMSRASQATGFNVAGYAKLTAALKDAQASQTHMNASQAQAASGAAGPALGAVLAGQANRTRELSAAQKAAIVTGTDLSVNLGIIKDAFGLTTPQAEKLTTAAGITAKQLGAAGGAGATATGKVLAFGNATNTAAGQTNAMTIAVTGLTNSINALITPLLTAEGDQVAWKQAQQSATAAIKANTGSLDSNKASALAARSAIISTTNSALSFAEAQVKLHGNINAASNIIQEQIRWLEQHAGKSKIAAAEIHALRMEEQQIKNLHQTITISGTGTWKVGEAGQGNLGGAGVHGQRTAGFAGGGYVSTGTGPTADDVIARVSKGEVIVPTYMVQAGEVDHLRGRLPGFATGGLVGWPNQEDKSTVTAIESATAAAFKAGALTNFGMFTGAAGGGNAVNMAIAKSLFPWPASMWPAYNYVEMREAGYNLTARNPSSGAYGVAQFINGPSEYAQYGGNVNTAGGQFTAMYNYIRQRYGNPVAAAAHEQAFNWYDNGGWMKSGTFGLNSSGKPEPVFSDHQWQILANNVKGGDGMSSEATLDDVVAGLADVEHAVSSTGPNRTGAAFGRAVRASARAARAQDYYGA
jgi:hypothetical protein